MTLLFAPQSHDGIPLRHAGAQSYCEVRGRSLGRALTYVRRAPTVPLLDALQIATQTARQADASTAMLRATALSLVGRGPMAGPLAGRSPDTDLSTAAPLLGGGAMLVLLVLCANVSSLLLVRLMTRRREFSVCTALGASRARLVRQTLIEHVVVGVVAVGAGIGFAILLVAVVRHVLPASILVRTLNPMALDARALYVACSAGVFAILTGGVLPAWIGTQVNATDALQANDRGGTESRGTRVFSRSLLVTETALACMLLVGATVLVWSFVKMIRTDRGMDTSNVLTAWVILPASAFADGPARYAAVTAIEAQLIGSPGVARVALSFGVPPGGGSHHSYEWFADGVSRLPETSVNSYDVGADFFDLYRIPLLRGRTFQPGDTDSDTIVGARLAEMLWPGQDPIGHTFRMGGPDTHNAWMTVIGVVGETTVPSLNPRSDLPEFYQALMANTRSAGASVPSIGGQIFLNIKCAGACPDPAQIRERIVAASPGVQLSGVGALEDAYQAEIARPRATAVMAMVFAVIGLAAAAGGLFSVLSYVAGRRRREFGVRAALGADARQLRGLVLRDGLVVAATGSAIGATGGWMLSRWIESLTYGVHVRDPRVWAMVIAALVVTVLASCWRPARQAALADPAMLLRDN